MNLFWLGRLTICATLSLLWAMEAFAALIMGAPLWVVFQAMALAVGVQICMVLEYQSGQREHKNRLASSSSKEE